jgi:hypothetical protein
MGVRIAKETTASIFCPPELEAISSSKTSVHTYKTSWHPIRECCRIEKFGETSDITYSHHRNSCCFENVELLNNSAIMYNYNFVV